MNVSQCPQGTREQQASLTNQLVAGRKPEARHPFFYCCLPNHLSYHRKNLLGARPAAILSRYGLQLSLLWKPMPLVCVPFVSMFCLQCSGIFYLRLTAGVSPSLRRPRCPLSDQPLFHEELNSHHDQSTTFSSARSLSGRIWRVNSSTILPCVSRKSFTSCLVFV
jgi:hypothetical protein